MFYGPTDLGTICEFGLERISKDRDTWFLHHVLGTLTPKSPVLNNNFSCGSVHQLPIILQVTGRRPVAVPSEFVVTLASVPNDEFSMNATLNGTYFKLNSIRGAVQ